MLFKKFSARSESLDDLKYSKPLTLEQEDNDLAFVLDCEQIFVDTDEELKEACKEELERVASLHNFTVDEMYSYMLKYYPYSSNSKWYNLPEDKLEELKVSRRKI